MLARAHRWQACVNRLYYACFHAVSALLALDELGSSKHSGVRSLFNHHFVKPGTIPKGVAAIYNDLFERRQEADYLDFAEFDETRVAPWLPQVQEFIEVIRQRVKSVVGEQQP